MSIASGINIPRHKRQYPWNGMPARGISGAFSRWLGCKYFAIYLVIRKINISRSVFSRRQHARTETADSAATGNTNCQKIRAEWQKDKKAEWKSRAIKARLFHLQELEEPKGVISREVGLVVKSDTSIRTSYTSVSAPTPLAPDEAMRSDNSSNSLKWNSHALIVNKMCFCLWYIRKCLIFAQIIKQCAISLWPYRRQELN